MKRYWSTVLGLPVLSSEDESMQGRLRAAFIHPETGQILAFLVGWFHVITPKDIRKWGTEAVWISSAQDLAQPEDILRLQEFGLHRTLLNGKRVLTRSQKYLGRLKDFSFDTTTDFLVTLDVAKHFLFWDWAHRSIPAKSIQEVTKKAIVLTVDDEPKEKVTQKIPAPLLSQ